jgi:hypothetical protein
MIIELSKDKSLRNVLLKANIDNNTMSLVKADAHVSDIKNSLIKNLNSSNMVQYRKYIAKAEDEEAEQKRIDEERDKEIRSEMGLDDDDASEVSSEGDLSTEISDTTQAQVRRQDVKKAIDEVNFLLKIKNATQSLLNVKVRKTEKGENTPSGFVITGQDAFKFFNQSKAKQYMTLIQLLKQNENYLVNKYKRVVGSDGTLDMGTKDENDDVNIIILTRQLLDIADKSITYETRNGKTNKKPFIEVFKDLYENTYEQSALGRRNKKREKIDFERFIKIANDEFLEDRDFENALMVLDKLQNNIKELEKKADRIIKLAKMKEKIAESDLEEVVEMKIERIMDAISIIESFGGKEIREKPVFRQKGKKIKTELPEQSLAELEEKYGDLEIFVRELQRLDKPSPPKGIPENMENSIISAYNKIKEILENKEKFIEEEIEELMEQIQKDIDAEKDIIENMSAFFKFEEDIDMIKSILQKLDDDPKIYDKEGVRNINVQQVIEESTKDIEGPKTNVARQNYIESQQESLKDKLDTLVGLRAKSIKRKITSVINKLNNSYNDTKKILKTISKVEDMTKEEYKDWLSGKTSKPKRKAQKITSLSNLIPDINDEEVSLYDDAELGELEEASDKLQSSLNALKSEKDKLTIELNKKIRFDEEGDKPFIYKGALA